MFEGIWDGGCRRRARLGEVGIDLTVGSTDGSYDNASAESIYGLCKTEMVQKLGARETAEPLEWETLKWVSWFNEQRLLGPIGNIPPAEIEALYERSQAETTQSA